MAYINFDYIREGVKTSFVHVACFAPIEFYLTPDQIRYPCDVHYALTKDEIRWYIKALHKMMPVLKWRALVKSKDKVVFVLDTKGYNYYTFLVYLTAFRYLTEFPLLVKKFFSEMAKADCKPMFEVYQDCHRDVHSHHALMYRNAFHPPPYGSGGVNITQEEFNQRIKDQSYKSVWSYFYAEKKVKKEPPKDEKEIKLP